MSNTAYENKFNLTKEENIFVAKRNIVDYIYESAKLEGLSVTFPDTEQIYEGYTAPAVSVNDIIAVNNLKRAWKFNLETIDEPVTLSYISQINKYVGGDSLIVQAGKLRKVSVRASGTSWKPSIPDEILVKERLSEIMELESDTERAISLMLYTMRSQLFIDGNKRTAMLAANHEMIRHGCGIISVPIDKQPDFRKMLVSFYETDNMQEIKDFVYENCIDGIDLRLQEKVSKQKEEEILDLTDQIGKSRK